MDLVWIIYIIEKLPGFIRGITSLGVVSFVAVLAMYAFVLGRAFVPSYTSQKEDDEIVAKQLKRFPSKRTYGLALCFLCVINLIPSEETAYKMLAAYGAQELIQLEETKQIGSRAYDTINKILDDFLKEGIPDEETLQSKQ